MAVVMNKSHQCLASHLLVSPPLHLCLIVAEIISLLALSQVRDTAELLVVVDRPVISPDAVNNTCIIMEENTVQIIT